MFRDKLIYYLANYTLQHSFEKEVIKLLRKENLNLLKKRNFILKKKANILSISLFSNIKGEITYLLIINI